MIEAHGIEERCQFERRNLQTQLPLLHLDPLRQQVVEFVDALCEFADICERLLSDLPSLAHAPHLIYDSVEEGDNALNQLQLGTLLNILLLIGQEAQFGSLLLLKQLLLLVGKRLLAVQGSLFHLLHLLAQQTSLSTCAPAPASEQAEEEQADNDGRSDGTGNKAMEIRTFVGELHGAAFKFGVLARDVEQVEEYIAVVVALCFHVKSAEGHRELLTDA